MRTASFETLKSVKAALWCQTLHILYVSVLNYTAYKPSERSNWKTQHILSGEEVYVGQNMPCHLSFQKIWCREKAEKIGTNTDASAYMGRNGMLSEM